MTNQNVSSAVMAQRIEARDALDDFPTPPWAVRAACSMIVPRFGIGGGVVREPCVNRGYMALGLQSFFPTVLGSDCHDYGAGYPVDDYLFGADPSPVDWTIANPPFRLAEQFINRALATSSVGVAMVLRLQFVEGMGRYLDLFRDRRPSLILQFTERVVMFKGRIMDPNEKYWDPKANEGEGAWKKPSSATAYCVFVWDAAEPARRTEFDWIAPCRSEFEKPGDYDLLGGAGQDPEADP
jgi:hypothetical protein